MFPNIVQQALLLAILPATIFPANLISQQSAYTGQITAQRVIPLPSATYHWELYHDPASDFALLSGNFNSGEAGFVDGITDKPTVRVLWNKPGTYFLKITVINSEGCSNFKIEKMEILKYEIAARIYPNPVNGNDLNFEISIQEGSVVTVDIYSTNRQLICRVFDGYLAAGVIKTIPYRNYLPQGIYTYRICTGSQVCSGRIICIKVY